jgi:hypothetical protein
MRYNIRAWGWTGLDSYNLGPNDCCDYSNELADFVKSGEFLGQISNSTFKEITCMIS